MERASDGVELLDLGARWLAALDPADGVKAEPAPFGQLGERQAGKVAVLLDAPANGTGAIRINNADG